MNTLRTNHPNKQRQRGAVFMIMLVIMVMGVVAFFVSALSSSALQSKRDEATAAALAQAKEALIGYAASVKLDSTCVSTSCARPGDLPCPDTSNTGVADSSCYGNALGRLPWKSLGLPDLRDSSGERLWYAVSKNFKNNPRTICKPTLHTGCLNSDSIGTITVFSPDGTLLNDGGSTGVSATGGAAVVIAPGYVLQRQGAVAPQDRSGPDNGTAKKTPSNYLDIATIGSITEDNANYIDGTSGNGFIQGRIKDSAGNLIVNDQLLVITQVDILRVIQKRVAGEVSQCLNDYAINNNYRFPWAVPLSDVTNYQDNANQFFGRVPDILFSTNISGGGNGEGGGNMSEQWGANCNTHTNQIAGTWWTNWREMVFYSVASTYKPSLTSASAGTCTPLSSCLSINSTIPAKFVVIVAGRILLTPTDQSTRNENPALPSLYLEGGNQNADQSGTYTFIQAQPTATFNDTLLYQQ